MIQRTNLHVSKFYVQQWGLWEALREFYQNWRDGTYLILKRALVVSMPSNLAALENDIIEQVIRYSLEQEPVFRPYMNQIQRILVERSATRKRVYIVTKPPENPDADDIMSHAGVNIQLVLAQPQQNFGIVKIKKFASLEHVTFCPVVWSTQTQKFETTDNTPQSPASSFTLNCKLEGEQADEIVSYIRYDPSVGRLIFVNPGYLSSKCFILGGSDAEKHSKNDKHILGKFGEGMKLAALALARNNKNISICTGNLKYICFVRTDSNFENELCLFLDRDDRIEQMDGGFYTVAISLEVEESEWKSMTRRFLDLSPIKHFRLCPTQPSRGYLLLNEQYASEVFCKGVFIKKDPYGRKFPYGFDFDDVELDRDRDVFKNEDELTICASDITGKILNDKYNNVLLPIDGAVKNRVDNMIHILVFHNFVHWDTYRHLHSHIIPKVALAFLEKVREKLNTVYCSSRQDDGNMVLLALKIGATLYPMINYYLFKCCAKSAGFPGGYVNPRDWLTSRVDIDLPVPTSDLPALQNLVEHLGQHIVVKNWEFHLCVERNNVLYIPKQLYDAVVNTPNPFATWVKYAQRNAYHLVNF